MPCASGRELSAGRASRQGRPAAGVGVGQEKPPSLRRWQEGCPHGLLTRAWPLSSRGPAWPGASSCYWVPLQRAPETKQSPVLKETQSDLFTEPCNDLEQHRPVFSRRKGASRNIRHRIQHMRERWTSVES